MNVLHVCASLSVNWGGPPRVVASLTEALLNHDVSSKIVAVDTHPGSVSVKTIAETTLSKTSMLARIWPGHSSATKRVIQEAVADADVIHIHELWHHSAFVAARIAQKRGIPYIVSTHGEMQNRFFRQKLYKKLPFWLFVQRPILQRASYVHVLNKREYEDAKGRGVQSSIKMIPNGVNLDLAKIDHRDAKRRMATRYPETRGKAVLLYMGRISQIKRLELLIESVVLANSRLPTRKFHLMIFGPEDHAAYSSRLRNIVDKKAAGDQITFGGVVSGSDRLETYAAVDIYAQSSAAEGSSMSLLEAGYIGLPIVATEECEFPAEEYGIGTTTEANPQDFSNGLLDVYERSQAGSVPSEEGLQRFRSDHSWDRIAGEFAALYRMA